MGENFSTKSEYAICRETEHNGSNMKCLRSRGGVGEHFVTKNGTPNSGDPWGFTYPIGYQNNQ